MPTKRVPNESKNIVQISRSLRLEQCRKLFCWYRSSTGGIGRKSEAEPRAELESSSQAQRIPRVVPHGRRAFDDREAICRSRTQARSVSSDANSPCRAQKMYLHQGFPARILCLPSTLLIPLESSGFGVPADLPTAGSRSGMETSPPYGSPIRNRSPAAGPQAR